MRIDRTGVTILAVLAAGIFGFGPDSAAEPTMPKAPYVLAQTVRQWQEENKKMTLVDVREPEEYQAGHIEGAINVPYAQMEQRVNEFKAQGPEYVFYCIHSSWRAPYSANMLADLGYKNVHILEGGIAAWNSGGQVIYASGNAKDPGVVAVYPAGLAKVLTHPRDRSYDGTLNLTAAELSYYDGQDGRRAYVAVEGVIYDVTQSRLWRGGTHDPSHGEASAGRDLTEVIQHSPHGTQHLKDFPVVGRLTKG